MKPETTSHLGLAAAASAFIAWGLLPIYWKALDAVPASEILCHRIVWSAPFVAILLTASRRWNEVLTALRSRRTAWLLTISSLLIGANWFTYIWAVNSAHVIEASLGYYINPLVSMLLGFIFFRDRLSRMQTFAICLGVAGVLMELWEFGRVPWIALVLALSFGLYGLVRKVAVVEALPGLFVETLALSVPAVAYLAMLETQGNAALGHVTLSTDALLVGAGAITSLPLAAFAFGARRLRLTTIGILQYIGPTGMFLLGVFLYGEPFSMSRLWTFAFIWTGVIVYTVDSLLRYRTEHGHRV